MELFEGVAVGDALPIDPSSELCPVMERLVPDMLLAHHREWAVESIDGFFFSSAVRSGDLAAALAGTCILIRDQRVTPFAFDLSLADPHTLRAMRIRLGEPGGGPLGISGPACNSSAARILLWTLSDRLKQVDWAYEISWQTPNRS